MKIIVVNAIAADRGGALSILKQFIANIPVNDEYIYLIFIDSNISILTENKNIRLEPIVGNKTWIKRFIWDFYGLRKWLLNNNIIPVATLSLQNTNFRVGRNLPNFVYYHQSLPFYSHSWSLWRKDERILWFYKNIYPLFVSIFLNKSTEIFVQLDYIKRGFVNYFKIPSYRVHVVHPEIKLPIDTKKVERIFWDDGKLHLFYPANSCIYKNHIILIQALRLLQNKDIVLHLTCFSKDLNFNCEGLNIDFMGSISFEKMLSMYNSVDALLFPSYIETYGLPLLEAAFFGVPIVVADLPYSREVLSEYVGANFVKYDDVHQWCKAISQVRNYYRYPSYIRSSKVGWSEMFTLIKNKI